jgi:hypothetical protein
MSEIAGRARIEHKPGLNFPWQVHVVNPKGKWVVLDAKRTEVEAEAVIARLKSSPLFMTEDT